MKKKYFIKAPEGYIDGTLHTDWSIEELEEVLIKGCIIEEIK